MRTGRTSFRAPAFMPDLGRGQFARSGTRGHIRFVSTGSAVGAYSTVAGARSKSLNRGAIVKIDDAHIEYLVTPTSSRSADIPNKKDLKHGPELPFNANPSQSGSISVTASVEQARTGTRKDVDAVLLHRDGSSTPAIWPIFWTHKHRMSEWLAKDSAPVFYEVSGRSLDAYRNLENVVGQLGSRGGCYIDFGERFIWGNESNKGNAGASRLLNRHVMEVGSQPALHFHLGFMPVCFSFQFERVYFLPDEVVVADSLGNCTFVPYGEISYTLTQGTQLGVPVPAWCQPVGYSWQYMNRDGGPDRRYNDNPQIPHYNVWELDFTFPGGRIDTAFADGNLANQLARCIDQLRQLALSRK